MAFKILSLINKEEWKGALERVPSSCVDVYFTPEYYSLYQNNGDGEALCFVFEKDGELVLYPFLKNPITKLGYELDKEYYDIQGAYGYNGVVASTKDGYFLSDFWETFDYWCCENDIIAEFTRFHPLLNNQRMVSSKMKTYFSRHTISLNLSISEDDIWKTQISSKNRNMIRKAEKEGVKIVESCDYVTFKNLYDGTMTNLQAEDFYFFPWSYYDEYKQTFSDNSMLFLAMYEGKPIAGAMFLFSDYYAHYHLSGRDKGYSRYAANNLILWHAIRKAKERGCKWFHFGGGTTGEECDTLLKFKKEFSRTKTEFWIGKRVHNEQVYEEIIRQWKGQFPENYNKNKVKLLGYREI